MCVHAMQLAAVPRLPGTFRGQGVVVTAHPGGQRRVCEDVRAVKQLVNCPDQRQPAQDRVVHAPERCGGEAVRAQYQCRAVMERPQ